MASVQRLRGIAGGARGGQHASHHPRQRREVSCSTFCGREGEHVVSMLQTRLWSWVHAGLGRPARTLGNRMLSLDSRSSSHAMTLREALDGPAPPRVEGGEDLGSSSRGGFGPGERETSSGQLGVVKPLERGIRFATTDAQSAESCAQMSHKQPDRGKLMSTHTETVMMSAIEKAMGKSLDVAPLAPQGRPLLIVVSGPSGVGKDAVISRLRELRPEMHFVVTATTRAQRQGEVDGQDYIFMERESFERSIANNELLEHALVYGEYKGIPKQQVRKALSKGTDVVLRLDVQGAATIRELIPGSVSVFLVAESERSLVRRLLARKTEPIDKALVRANTAGEETKRMHEFDYVVENEEGKLEETVAKLCAIIDAEKMRTVQKKILV